MMKRVLLFLGTNLLIVAMISIITSVLGLHGYLTKHGIDYQSLAIFCLIWGMAGSLISLFMSKVMAKMAIGVQIIDPRTTATNEQALLQTVYLLSKKAGLTTMPEVGIYDSPELNAFATGPSRNNALVAVSSGLLHSMNREQVEGVLAHEISHVANGDMVTMTLLQGIINAFAMFLSRIAAYAVSAALSRGEDDRENNISTMTFYFFTFIFDILFTLLGSILVAAFSRWREYRADAGGARLAGKQSMISALQRLQGKETLEDDRAPAFSALKISHRPAWLELFSSHPPLEQRIKRLQKSH
jgi:heat shock protein HtpX